jgi:hypothetical protein
MRGSFNLTLELLSEIYLKCGSIPNKAWRVVDLESLSG